jgi:hypothetical protein
MIFFRTLAGTDNADKTKAQQRIKHRIEIKKNCIKWQNINSKNKKRKNILKQRILKKPDTNPTQPIHQVQGK